STRWYASAPAHRHRALKRSANCDATWFSARHSASAHVFQRRRHVVVGLRTIVSRRVPIERVENRPLSLLLSRQWYLAQMHGAGEGAKRDCPSGRWEGLKPRGQREKPRYERLAPLEILFGSAPARDGTQEIFPMKQRAQPPLVDPERGLTSRFHH